MNRIGLGLVITREVVMDHPEAALMRMLYEEHGAGETYVDQAEVESTYRAILPGTRIYHHLEWRYTAVWQASSN